MRRLMMLSIVLLLNALPPAHAALISFWDFETGTGSTVSDSVSGYTCTFAGNATWTTGLIGTYGMTLDGAGDSCDIASPNAALQPTSQFAISVWFQGTTTDTGGADAVNLGDHYGLRVESSGNVSCFYQEGAGTWRSHTASPAVNVLAGGKHHIFCQKTASAIEIYIDNVAKGSTSFATSVYYTGGGTTFSIGRNTVTGNQDTNGVLDHVRFYDASISTGDIATLYAEGGTTARRRAVIISP